MYSNDMRMVKEKLLPKCPFCRHPAPKSEKEINMNMMKRIEAYDPVAICEVGVHRHAEGDYEWCI
jgi:hypothetical protein